MLRRRRILSLVLCACVFDRGCRSLSPAAVRSARIRELHEARRHIDLQLEALESEELTHRPANEEEKRTTPRRQIQRLYQAFNSRDAAGVADVLSEDILYEDLLLGDTTICRGKESFKRALEFHPAFVSSRLDLPFQVELVVDQVACDSKKSVGVEWHVEWNGKPIPLGRGLSLATLDDDGKLNRVVDICEAPWRTVGLLVRPFISAFGASAALTTAVYGASVILQGQTPWA